MASFIDDTLPKPKQNIIVRGRMYSKNKLLHALHIKSERWLVVDVERKCFTFHTDKEGVDAKSDAEVPFSKIIKVHGVIQEGVFDNDYYIHITTAEGDLDFKLKAKQDFQNVYSVLKSELNDKINIKSSTKSQATESILGQESVNKAKKEHSGDENSSVSSDDKEDYVYDEAEKNRLLKTPDSKINKKQLQSMNHNK